MGNTILPTTPQKWLVENAHFEAQEDYNERLTINLDTNSAKAWLLPPATPLPKWIV